MICPLCHCDMNSTTTSVEHYQCRVAYEKGRNESADLLTYSQKRHADVYSELTRLREAIEKAPCDCRVIVLRNDVAETHHDLTCWKRDALKEEK